MMRNFQEKLRRNDKNFKCDKAIKKNLKKIVRSRVKFTHERCLEWNNTLRVFSLYLVIAQSRR